MLIEARNRGKLKGIKVSTSSYITHIRFVDDVIMFGSGSLREWKELSRLINTFRATSRMDISTEKSSFLRGGIIDHIILLFPYKVELWDKGLITLVIGPIP